MASSGRTTSFGSRWQYLVDYMRLVFADSWGATRPAPLLEGETGKALQHRVWHEVQEALLKQAPEVLDYIKI